ncbi:MAG TPA: molybdate ABC transporter permease subunit [Candidatus Krumholzibacteria bacterium]
MAISALWISLKVGLLALLLMAATGTPLAWLLAKRRFWGSAVFESMLSLPLILPPVVTGFALLWLLAPSGPLGLNLLFRWQAASVAAAVVAFPLFLRSAREAFEGVDPRLEQAARNLGASPWQGFWRLSLPLARRGLVAASLLGFGRALGEFGATILVAGNIPGRTQTIPLAIFSLSQTSDLQAVWPLVGMATVLAFILVFLADRLAR